MAEPKSSWSRSPASRRLIVLSASLRLSSRSPLADFPEDQDGEGRERGEDEEGERRSMRVSCLSGWPLPCRYSYSIARAPVILRSVLEPREARKCREAREETVARRNEGGLVGAHEGLGGGKVRGGRAGKLELLEHIVVIAPGVVEGLGGRADGARGGYPLVEGLDDAEIEVGLALARDQVGLGRGDGGRIYGVLRIP